MQTKSADKQTTHFNKRLIISLLIFFIVIPLTICVGVVLFNDRKYNIISILIAFLSCIPFFLAFEKRKPQPREMMCISVMTGISVAGRFAFAMIPGFKPVTAITAITGFSFGPEAGFLTGAMSAIVSNIFFGQGPWTPFQMFTWGLLGFIAGLLGKAGISRSKIVLVLYGIFSGILFSFCMDIWFVVSIDGLFNWKRYTIAIASAIPFTITYAVSNVIFLLLLTKPIEEKLMRIKIKYGLM
ncbi:ECF transporter S component [Heyndrickxia sp. NPDC080065]|uniref:ECF transporter S component n=1 Tax=Heyndrickxia sp. NPDC080065 TaxID=3390568 RepID=UPI003CFD4315